MTPLFLLFRFALLIPFATQTGAILGAVTAVGASFVIAYWDALTELKPLSYQWVFPVSLTLGLAVGCGWSLLKPECQHGDDNEKHGPE